MVDIKDLNENEIQIIKNIPKGHLRMNFRVRPRPKPRETQKTRFVNARVREYRNWATQVKETLAAELKKHYNELPIYPGQRLGIAFGFGATKKAPANARKTKKGKVDGRQVKGINDWDMSNLIKGVEDIMNGLVYDDDKQIRWYGPCFAEDTTSDWMSVHVWQNSRWQDIWDRLTVYSIMQWKDNSKNK